ncbi:mucin-binding protein, partial [Weissella confusa]|uniref:mucin-binding protein n=2 Tax=Weissella confusa TaxID=1583 RepID=UPI0018F1BE63
ETKTVTSTVTYEGVKPAQAASEKTATVTHTYQTDEVTNDRILAADSAKYADDAKYKADTYTVATDDDVTIDTQTGGLTFNDVKSPVVPGYTADKLTVQNKTATKVATDGTISYDDVATVVNYTAHAQKATVVFKDLTTGETLTASDVALTGTSDGDIDFTDAKATLAGLEAKHYYVVTDLPASEAFDHADNEDQTITVELRHEIADHSETKTVTSTVTYEGVKPAQAASEKTATVTHTYQTDEVTDDRIQAADSAKYADDAKYKADTYAVATDDDATIDAQMGDLTFSDVKSPVVPGYTADKLTVQNKTATKVAADGTVGYDDVQSVVTYAPNDQTVKVHYDNTDLTPNQQNSVPNGGSDFTLTGKTDAPYETATVNGGPTTVPAVPGYTFTVTSNGKTTFTSDDKNPTYDFKSATDGHVFTVTEDGLTDGDYTITYTPNEVTGQVIVIDDEKNESIQTDNLNGKTDADVVYDSAVTIKNFTDQGYVLVSNDLSDAKTYNADDANNRFEIHLKHNTADGTGTPTTTVRHTTITTPDGKTTTVDQTVEVTPHFSVDQVTKTRVPDGDLADKTKYDNTETPWFEENDKTPEGTVGVTDFDKKTGTPTFGDVDVPNVPGYTVVRTNEPNGDQTVTYTANEAKAQVVYVDDTTSDTLKTADIKGVTDAEMDYNSDDVIADYKSQGYVLVSDGFAEGTKYDNVDDSKTDSQVFEVHLKHNTADGTDTPTTVVRHTTITTPDGKTTTVDQTVDVTPHFSVDQVTKTRVPDEELDNDKKYDNTETPWFEENDKTPEGTVGATDFDKNTGTPTFGDVDVPDVPGYTIVRTPNDPAKPNGDQTVTYAANEAKVQVVYVDDVTGDTLKTVDVKGVTDAKIDYNSDDVIADYESQGYVLVSDGFAEGTKYDNIDDSKTDSQVFEVHLKHNTADGTGEPTTVVRHTTIKTPHGEPTTVDQTVEVTPHFSVDQVTKTRVPDDELNDKTKYDNTETPWFEEHDKTPTGTTGATDFDKNTGTPTFGDVDVPEVPGYTVVRTPNDPSQPNGDQTVTYTANGVTGQVVVIDDATGKPVQTDELTGNTDADVVYDSAATIKHFTDMGYVLVSNDLSDAKMYNADDAKNRFEIHLKHNTADGTGTPTTTVRHTTITTPDGKKTTVDQTVEITPHYSVDQVTGERVPDGDLDDKTKYDNTETPWFEEHDKTPDGTNGVTGFDKKTGTPTFGDVDVPEVPGYTPVRTSEPNGDQTVTYVAKYVTGKVVVIDDVTGATLRTDDLAGKTDANVDYDSAATIKNFTDKGYVLVSNDLSDAKTYNFDAAKNVFEIHLKHDTMDGTGTPTTVVRHTTIQTPDGKTVTVEQIVEVTPHYSVDKVTGERVPDDQLGDDTKYANTETPWFESHDKTSTDITGMTGFDEKTGTPTFGEVAVPTIPGYKMVRTNEPNGDQVVTFVPDGSAVVETSNNVQPVATVATPQTTIATPSRMIPMNNVVAGTPAPTTNTVDGELPVFVETVNNTPVVNKDNLWIHEIPDDKDGDIANLNSLNDMSWRTSDPYLVAMLIAALAAAGMFGVLLAFYRRREAVERKLAERRED